MSELLSKQDVEAVTGYKQPAAQLRWFSDRGINAYMNAAGRVIATWYAINHPAAANDASDEPDFSALGSL